MESRMVFMKEDFWIKRIEEIFSFILYYYLFTSNEKSRIWKFHFWKIEIFIILYPIFAIPIPFI